MFDSPISSLCEYQLQRDARKKTPPKQPKKKKMWSLQVEIQLILTRIITINAIP